MNDDVNNDLFENDSNDNNNDCNEINSTYISTSLETFAKIFWVIGLICSAFIYISYFIQIYNSDILEYSFGTGILIIIAMTIVLLVVIAILYFNVLLLRGFAAIVNNTSITNEKLNSIIEILHNQSNSNK